MTFVFGSMVVLWMKDEVEAGDWRLRLLFGSSSFDLWLLVLLILAVDCWLTSSAFADDSSAIVDANSALSRSTSFCNTTSAGDSWSAVDFLFFKNLRSSFFVRVGTSLGISLMTVACFPLSND